MPNVGVEPARQAASSTSSHTHLALTPPRPLYTFTQHLLLPSPNFSSAPSPLYSSLAPPQSHHTSFSRRFLCLIAAKPPAAKLPTSGEESRGLYCKNL